MGRITTDETRIKLRQANTGKAHSDETRAKITLANLGRRYTDETRAKMSKSHLGHIVTDETRTKMSKYKTKPVKQLDKHTGEVIKEWPSVGQAARELGYSEGNIATVCRGERETTGGYKWAFVNG